MEGVRSDLVAGDVMTENPRTVRADATVGEAVQVLEDMDFRHLPVVDESGDLVGMVSDRDLRALEVPFVQDDETIATLLLRALAPVSAIMSSNVISVNEDARLSEVAELMTEHKIGAVPVVDGEGQIVGIVSTHDILRLLVNAA
jgi:CBS domain-containing protein